MWYQSIQSIQANMVELVKDNMEKAQETQKRWYDLNARERSFEVYLLGKPFSVQTDRSSCPGVARLPEGEQEFLISRPQR
ncbi:hypothetical protein EMCRGX_G002863 [Ephydatia muelleri]